MARIWLRLELFELGLLPLPSKYAASLTLANVKKALDALHARFQAAADAAAGDSAMEDGDATGGFVESDNLHSVSFAFWKEAVEGIFQWREQDYVAFWLLLVQFHRTIPVAPQFAASAGGGVLDEAQSLEHEQVPVFKLAVFLFVQTVKPHSWRSKYSLEAFNAVWYREHADSLAAAGSESPAALAAKSPRLGPRLGGMSPRLMGGASPPPPQSPHTVGLQDRSTSDSYYLGFVREKLEDLFALLYPSAELKDDSATVVSADHIDLLGFLLCCGDSNMMVDQNAKLSDAYENWKHPEDEADKRVENGATLCRFCKTHLSLNEKLYPPTGFSLAGALQSNAGITSVPILPLNDEFSLDGDLSAPVDESQTPTVLSQYAKTTVIKRAEEFPDGGAGKADLVIFSCFDTIIYVLGAVRNVMITACKNCKIVMGPSTGILLLERCENVQLTTIAALARVSNCLDSRLNVYTLCRPILSGENVGVVVGPYNTKYPGLSQILSACSFQFPPESSGCWNAFLNMEAEKDSMEESEKESIALQSPAAFREVCVPIKPSAAGSAERPFAIPPEFAAAVKAQLEMVESLRQLVRSDEFDLQTKRTIEMVIQLRFKDWLAATGNVRQILDLMHLERTGGGGGGGEFGSSPVKDKA